MYARMKVMKIARRVGGGRGGMGMDGDKRMEE